MGIYTQPNDWQCGPFALKHALLALGSFEHENVIARLAASDTSGTDEVGLGRAARRLGCDLLMVRTYDADAARRALDQHLALHTPTLLCIQEWTHWVAVVHQHDGHYVAFDSREEGVLKVLPWEELRGLLVYHEGGAGHGAHPIYDLHPVVPRHLPWAWAEFSPHRARELLKPERRSIVQRWERYATGLKPVCIPLSLQGELALPLAELLERHRAAVAARVEHVGGGDAGALLPLVSELAFVAEVYGLEVRPDAEALALDRVSALVARWAAEDGEGTRTAAVRAPRAAAM